MSTFAPSGVVVTLSVPVPVVTCSGASSVADVDSPGPTRRK